MQGSRRGSEAGSSSAVSHDGHAPGHHAPKRIRPKSLADYLEVMAFAMFQAGISWRVVEAKWPEMRESFGGFDPRTIASWGPAEVERLLADRRVIRNRRKIEGLVDNARTMLAVEAEAGSFRAYLRSYPDYESLASALKKRFKWLGDRGAYYFLFVVGEPVPDYADWLREHPPSSGRAR